MATRYRYEMMEADENDLLNGRKRHPTFAEKQAAAEAAMRQRQQFRDMTKGLAIDRYENLHGRHVNLVDGEEARARMLSAAGRSGLVGPSRPDGATERATYLPRDTQTTAPTIQQTVAQPPQATEAVTRPSNVPPDARLFIAPQMVRDHAMMRRQAAINRAMLEGQTNRYSVFNPNHPQYNPMRAQLLLDQEEMRLRMADIERASRPPRYALPTDPGQAEKRAELERMFEQELIREAQAKMRPEDVGPPDLSGVGPRVSEFRGKLERNAALSPEEAAARADAIAVQHQRTREAQDRVRADQATRDEARARLKQLADTEYNRLLAEQRALERTAARAAELADYGASKARELAELDFQADVAERRARERTATAGAERADYGASKARELAELDFRTAAAEQRLRERAATLGAERAEGDVSRTKIDNEILNIVAPSEVERTRIINDRINSPIYRPAVERIASAIKQMSGKNWNLVSKHQNTLNAGIMDFNALPDHLKPVAALEVISYLSDSDTDLPKEVWQDAGWTRFLSHLIPFTTPSERKSTAMQEGINKVIESLRRHARRSPIGMSALRVDSEAAER